MTPKRNPAVAQRFGRNLLRYRRQVAMSQDELSERASLHRTEISMLERGLTVPRIDTLIKLASALEVPADQLLDGIVWVSGSYTSGGFSFSSVLDSTALKPLGGD